MKVQDFIGEKVIYLEEDQRIYGENAKGEIQLLLEIRGWGAIQRAFEDKKGWVDVKKAESFQDELAKWIVDAINQKLNKQ